MRSPLSAATLLSPLLAMRSALAEPVQYCRSGYNDGQADFCMGISTHVNATTQSSDLYLSLTVTRSSALGWTAIGTGSEMAGSAMFIVYGDPLSGADPVLSIRTIDGHHQPVPIDLIALPDNASLRILRSKWQKAPGPRSRRHEDDPNYPILPQTPATHTADIAIACYNCPLSLWKLSAASKSQPFIWAWNDRQKFDSYPLDAHLAMHRHHANSGGFGTFYVDMPQSLSPSPSPSTITPALSNLHTSDSPLTFTSYLSSLRARPLPKAHGFLMFLSFMLLFPLGVVLMRTPSASGNPFRKHWVVQATATALTYLGTIVGIVMTRGRMPSTVHQWMGVGISLALGAQVLLGWRHHVLFLRVFRRTWVSHAHIWIGRAVLLAGWANVLSGMVMSGMGGFGVAVVGGLAVVEAVGVGLWVWVAAKRRKAEGEGQTEGMGLMAAGEGTEDYFAIEMSDDEFGVGSDSENEGEGRGGEKKGVALRQIKR